MGLSEKITELVRELNHVSFVEVEERFPEVLDADGGNLELHLKKNCIAWSGWTKEAFAVVFDLIKNGAIKLGPAGELTYFVDGKQLNIPKASTVREYARPRWLPVVLCQA